MDNEMITVREIAKYLRISLPSAYKLFVCPGKTLFIAFQILRHFYDFDQIPVGNQHREILNATKFCVIHGYHLQTCFD